MAKKYRKKPVVIEAMQLVAGAKEVSTFMDAYLWIKENTLGMFEPLDVLEGKVPVPSSGVSIDPASGRLMIATLEGIMYAKTGDWIIKGVQGEFYPCKPDIFAATYEEAE